MSGSTKKESGNKSADITRREEGALTRLNATVDRIDTLAKKLELLEKMQNALKSPNRPEKEKLKIVEMMKTLSSSIAQSGQVAGSSAGGSNSKRHAQPAEPISKIRKPKPTGLRKKVTKK